MSYGRFVIYGKFLIISQIRAYFDPKIGQISIFWGFLTEAYFGQKFAYWSIISRLGKHILLQKTWQPWPKSSWCPKCSKSPKPWHVVVGDAVELSEWLSDAGWLEVSYLSPSFLSPREKRDWDSEFLPRTAPSAQFASAGAEVYFFRT